MTPPGGSVAGLSAVEQEFPGWRLWCSHGDEPGDGRIWAVRTGSNRKRPHRASPEWAMTVGDVVTVGEIRDILLRQSQLDSG